VDARGPRRVQTTQLRSTRATRGLLADGRDAEPHDDSGQGAHRDPDAQPLENVHSREQHGHGHGHESGQGEDASDAAHENVRKGAVSYQLDRWHGVGRRERLVAMGARP
jgi:hypothetical protein